MNKQKITAGFPLAPLPVAVVSCGTTDAPLAMTVSWTGIVCSSPLKIYISVQPIRNSYSVIKQSGEFVLNLVSPNELKIADFCGTTSGNKIDKFSKLNITAVPSHDVSAPSIGECPVSIECRVSQSELFGSHEMFIADVLGVYCDEKYVDGGSIDMQALSPVIYGNSIYYAFGDRLGGFGCTKDK